MTRFIDQMHRAVELPRAPQRIVSLVPSQTELLFYLGVGDHVVGVTTFCRRPAGAVETRARVGGTKQLNLDRIRALQPDLVLGNREENERSQIEALCQELPVWMSDILDLPDALAMIAAVGAMVDRTPEAARLIEQIKAGFAGFAAERDARAPASTTAAYLIWRRPYMVSGHSTFITAMMTLCGLRNIFKDDRSSRYPVVSKADLQKASPEVILLSSEPFPFAEKHIPEFQHLCPQSRVLTVDGEIFSWYGPRLLHGPNYFRALSLRIAASSHPALPTDSVALTPERQGIHEEDRNAGQS